MIARSFQPVVMGAMVAGAVLGCYLVSLRVAAERSALETVENKIVMAERDIRLLSTEIETRGRLPQLERWNVKFIRLSAPSADQFVRDGFHLATLAQPKAKPTIDAPVVFASAPAPVAQQPVVTSDADAAPAPAEMMHTASYSVAAPKSATSVVKLSVAPAKPKATTAAAVKAPAPKAEKIAMADPLAPLSAAPAKAKAAATRKPKDSADKE